MKFSNAMKGFYVLVFGALFLLAVCNSTPSGGAGMNKEGTVSTRAGWRPVSGKASSDGSFGVEVK